MAEFISGVLLAIGAVFAAIVVIYFLWLILWVINAILKSMVDNRKLRIKNEQYARYKAGLELKLLKETYEQRSTKS